MKIIAGIAFVLIGAYSLVGFLVPSRRMNFKGSDIKVGPLTSLTLGLLFVVLGISICLGDSIGKAASGYFDVALGFLFVLGLVSFFYEWARSKSSPDHGT
jgi:hypothetical protein